MHQLCHSGALQAAHVAAARATSTDNVGWEDLIDASLAALREQLEIDAVSTPELDGARKTALMFASPPYFCTYSPPPPTTNPPPSQHPTSLCHQA